MPWFRQVPLVCKGRCMNTAASENTVKCSNEAAFWAALLPNLPSTCLYIHLQPFPGDLHKLLACCMENFRHTLNLVSSVGLLTIFSQESPGTGAPEWLSWLSIWLLVAAQVMVSQFVGLSPTLGSVLAVWSLLGILSPSLSAPPSLTHAPSLSKMNK